MTEQHLQPGFEVKRVCTCSPCSHLWSSLHEGWWWWCQGVWPLAVGLTTVVAILGGSNTGGATNPVSGLSAAILYWDVRNLAEYLIANIAVRVLSLLPFLRCPILYVLRLNFI